MGDHTVVLHRVIKAPISKVFRAFSDPRALKSWIPPYGFLCEIQEMDFKIGGSFKMSFLNFTTEKSQSFGGNYLDIQPNELLKYSDTFDDPNLPGTMTTTVWFKEVICGTDIIVTQEGIPQIIPIEMCYLGWQESLDKLIKLVEPNIEH